MKLAIVDDSPADSCRLSCLITRYCQENHLFLDIYSFCNGSEFLKTVHTIPTYDAIFLDIFMDGLDGMEIARQLRAMRSDSLIIFITTSTEHAIESYRVRAFDYLIKPYSYEQLSEVLSLCDQTILHNMRFIEVKEGRIMKKILLRDILYTDYYNHYIQIHTQKKVIRSYMQFAVFSQFLLPYPQFLCCYRNCIVNLDKVISMDEQDFIVENGEHVPIARANRNELRQQYADYAFYRLDRGT